MSTMKKNNTVWGKGWWNRCFRIIRGLSMKWHWNRDNEAWEQIVQVSGEECGKKKQQVQGPWAWSMPSLREHGEVSVDQHLASKVKVMGDSEDEFTDGQITCLLPQVCQSHMRKDAGRTYNIVTSGDWGSAVRRKTNFPLCIFLDPFVLFLSSARMSFLKNIII